MLFGRQAGGRGGTGPAEQVGDQPIADEGEIAGDEEIAPHREDPARFPQTPQVGHADEREHPRPEQDAVGVERGHRGGEGGHARAHAHRHRERVVDQERGARHQAGIDSQVVLGDEIVAGALRVLRDGLAVGGDDDGDHQADGDADGHREGERAHPRQQEHAQDLLAGIRHRGEIVGGEDGEAGELVETLVARLRGGDGAPHEELLEAADLHRCPGASLPRQRRWNGTSTTTTRLRKSSAPLMRSAVWLWRRCCHQRRGMNSGMTMVTMWSSPRARWWST